MTWILIGLPATEALKLISRINNVVISAKFPEPFEGLVSFLTDVIVLTNYHLGYVVPLDTFNGKWRKH